MRASTTARPAPTPAQRFVGKSVVTDRFGVSARTVERWVADGTLPAYRIGPKLVRFDIADVEALARRIKAAS